VTCPQVVAISHDAKRILFKDLDPLVADDTDQGTDIYLSRVESQRCRDKVRGATPAGC
jgi:hypothetical protein